MNRLIKRLFILTAAALLFISGIGTASFAEDQVDQLIEVLKQDSSYSRMEAAKKLGKIKDVKAVEPLIAALKDNSLDVRWAASQALGEIGDKRAIEPLNQLLKQESISNIKNVITEALKKLTGEYYENNIKPTQSDKKTVSDKQKIKTATISQESNTETLQEMKLQPPAASSVAGTIVKLDKEKKIIYIKPEGANTEQDVLEVSWNDKTRIFANKLFARGIDRDNKDGALAKMKFTRDMTIEDVKVGQGISVEYITADGIQIVNGRPVGKQINRIAKEIKINLK